MAGTTYPVVCILRILENVLCTVRTVAYQAVLIGLASNMRLVTCETGWLHTMLCGIDTCDMTAYAAHLSVVLAGILCHLLAFRIPVTDLACNNLFTPGVLDLFLHAFKRNVQRGMRIGMTLETVGECLTVLQAMTP